VIGEDGFVQVGQSEEARRHKRFEYTQPFQGTNDGAAFNGHIQDISASGAAIALDAENAEDADGATAQFSNYDFIELHIESMDKKISAQVVRKYEGGYAVKFDVTQQEQDRIQQEIDRFHELGGPKNA
jgi:hypothetical protein